MSALAYADRPIVWPLTVVVGVSVVSRSVVAVAVVGVVVLHSHKPRPALENEHAIFLPRDVYVAMHFKLLGWAGWPVPCALHVSDQSGRI